MVDDIVAGIGIGKVKHAVFRDALRRGEEEHLVLDDRAAEGDAEIIPIKGIGVRIGAIQGIRRVKSVVAVEKGSYAMVSVSSGLGDDVDDSAGRLAEFGLVTGCQHLEFGDRLLVELSRGAAVYRILVRLPVDKKIVVAAALAQDRVCVVTS